MTVDLDRWIYRFARDNFSATFIADFAGLSMYRLKQNKPYINGRRDRLKHRAKLRERAGELRLMLREIGANDPMLAELLDLEVELKATRRTMAIRPLYDRNR